MAGEFFNADAVISNCRNLELASPGEYLNWLTYREGKNGFLVSKLSITHLEMLEKLEILNRIYDVSLFIMASRDDKLAQSISADLAEQTGKWTHLMRGRKREDELEFSLERLNGTIASIVAQNNAFLRFFERCRIAPEFIVYEEFLEDPELNINRLSERLGIIGLRHDAAKIKLEKQAGRINEAWRARYIDAMSCPFGKEEPFM
jgi:trehalose 2-sulfotransferase